MASSNRNESEFIASLINDKAYLNYDLFAFIRAIEKRSPLYPGLGFSQTPRDDPIRLGQSPLLSFFPSAITNIEQTPNENRYRIINSYWGLFGINGALPTQLSEYAYDRKVNHQDSTLSAFADIFHHRLLSLYYRAWKMGQAAINFDKTSTNLFLTHISALSCQTSLIQTGNSQTDNSQTDNNDKLLLSGILNQKNRSIAIIEQVLGEQLAVKAKIHPFQGQWLNISQQDLSRLGSDNSHLGQNSIAGKLVYDRLNKVKVCLLDLSLKQYLMFLPKAHAHKKLSRLLKSLLPREIDVQVQLVLTSGQSTPSKLNGKTQLGFDSWLSNKAQKVHRPYRNHKSYLIDCY